jgi:hypothetical protein
MFIEIKISQLVELGKRERRMMIFDTGFRMLKARFGTRITPFTFRGKGWG